MVYILILRLLQGCHSGCGCGRGRGCRCRHCSCCGSGCRLTEVSGWPGVRRDAHACGGIRTPGITARERREELDMAWAGGRGQGRSRPSCPQLTDGDRGLWRVGSHSCHLVTTELQCAWTLAPRRPALTVRRIELLCLVRPAQPILWRRTRSLREPEQHPEPLEVDGRLGCNFRCAWHWRFTTCCAGT